MDLDFPLILVVLVIVTGVIWLIDALLLAPRRKKSSAMQGDENTAETPPEASALVEYSKSFFPVLLVVLLLRSFLYEPFQIPSGSMLPTLEVGDFILVNKSTYGLRLPVLGTKVVTMNDPQRGDVMVFKFPENTKINFIKRVVGLPGDRIRYANKQLYVNGEVVPQRLIAQLPPGRPQQQLIEEQLGDVTHNIYRNLRSAGPVYETVVPAGHYFVMGDNRDNSNDSRFWGFVPDELVVGEAEFVWLHWDSFWSLPSFANVGSID